jgi:predicted DNA-binding transcriptional regulator YafY
MPINKNAFIRYQTLDRCFRNPGRNYFIEDLLDACNIALHEFDPNIEGIKKRQLYDDIRFMESEQGWSVPLARYKLGKKTFYRYSDLSFSINNQPLNQMEAEQLRSAIMVLSKFRGMPQFEWVNELIPKLKQTFQLTNSEREVISFETNIFLKGIEYIEILFNAILNKQVLNIKYQPFKADKALEVTIHPYFLKQYNNRWFLFGLSDKYRNLSTYALDRILSVDVIQKTYIENNHIDFNEYFEEIVGVTIPKNEKVETILLKMDNDYAPYILTKPIHGSQKVKKEKGETIISIEVIPNNELINLILGMGTHVEILEPNYLRNKITEIVREMFKKYK